jgi:hypothetical protein
VHVNKAYYGPRVFAAGVSAHSAARYRAYSRPLSSPAWAEMFWRANRVRAHKEKAADRAHPLGRKITQRPRGAALLLRPALSTPSRKDAVGRSSCRGLARLGGLSRPPRRPKVGATAQSSRGQGRVQQGATYRRRRVGAVQPSVRKTPAMICRSTSRALAERFIVRISCWDTPRLIFIAVSGPSSGKGGVNFGSRSGVKWRAYSQAPSLKCQSGASYKLCGAMRCRCE